MSCSLWRWTPSCDHDACPGDCDLCSFEPEEYYNPLEDDMITYVEGKRDEGTCYCDHCDRLDECQEKIECTTRWNKQRHFIPGLYGCPKDGPTQYIKGMPTDLVMRAIDNLKGKDIKTVEEAVKLIGEEIERLKEDGEWLEAEKEFQESMKRGREDDDRRGTEDSRV